jgi:hypothetical protein
VRSSVSASVRATTWSGMRIPARVEVAARAEGAARPLRSLGSHLPPNGWGRLNLDRVQAEIGLRRRAPRSDLLKRVAVLPSPRAVCAGRGRGRGPPRMQFDPCSPAIEVCALSRVRERDTRGTSEGEGPQTQLHAFRSASPSRRSLSGPSIYSRAPIFIHETLTDRGAQPQVTGCRSTHDVPPPPALEHPPRAQPPDGATLS